MVLLKIRVHSWLHGIRALGERGQRLVDSNPGQFIFEPDRSLWRKRCGIVERRDRHVDRVGILGILDKQMRAATCSE
jgi:hypothetical protein